MSVVRDVLFVVGLAMVGVGTWWLSPAVALIVVGVICLTLAILPALLRK